MPSSSTDRMALAGLLCALLLATFYAGAFYEGRQVAKSAAAEMQELQRRHARTVAWLSGERTQAQARLSAEIDALKNQHQTDQEKADEDHRTHVSGLRAGSVSVRVPIVPASCQPAGSPASGVSGAGSAAASAELDPETAAALESIPHEGDAAIRKLNLCISQYNAVRTAFEQWRQRLQEADHVQAR